MSCPGCRMAKMDSLTRIEHSVVPQIRIEPWPKDDAQMKIVNPKRKVKSSGGCGLSDAGGWREGCSSNKDSGLSLSYDGKIRIFV